MFTTYILYSESLGKFYIGFTKTTVQSRLSKHLASKRGFTAKVSDWKIVYTEVLPTKEQAMTREKQLKSWKSKHRIQSLINRSSTE